MASQINLAFRTSGYRHPVRNDDAEDTEIISMPKWKSIRTFLTEKRRASNLKVKIRDLRAYRALRISGIL